MESAITPTRIDREVEVSVDRAGWVRLAGHLTALPGASAIVLFAHGSGSSRFSPRNLYVADMLENAGLATLLMDLLTPAEEREDERTARLRFDIALLGERLIGAVDWLATNGETAGLPVALFGASTGAAAALIAAAARPERVAAVVSRGGRPDLAGRVLAEVRAPTLLIVGGADTQVVELNQQALAQLTCEKQLVLVPGATHLFEEPGALEQVAHLATRWFVDKLGARDR
jgi:putative phosphoribosyl transferase